jgi:PiT family inorganic phosphate transporter
MVIGLSAIGIPASFVIIATMAIVRLGWGRATCTVTVSEGIRGEVKPTVPVWALAAESPAEEAHAIGKEDPEEVSAAADLFDPTTTRRVIAMQNVAPILSTVGTYAPLAPLRVRVVRP